MNLSEEQKLHVIELLRRGEHLPPEYEELLFPRERQECELVYAGKTRKEEVLAETMGVPFQLARSFGDISGDWHNLLIFGDNLQALKTLSEHKRLGKLKNADGTDGVKLVYIDPPFATKQEFRGKEDQKAYQDKIVGAKFIEFIRRRLILIKSVLHPEATVFVHIDWKKQAYLKVVLDEVFGEEKFLNEVVWYYYNKMQGNVNHFARNHDSLLWYRNGSSYHFTSQKEARDKATKQIRRVWDKDQSRLVNLKGDDGKVLYQESTEKTVDDVWRVAMLQPADQSQRTDYPTQKPERLLELVIASASKPGDIVLDAFAGSGTTLAVAEKLGRRWVGIDCGKLAIYTVQKRMLSLRKEIGNKGKALTPKPFALYNAGQYDFSKLRELPWPDWRFFALNLFECQDAPHEVNGLQLDGKRKGASVMVWNHVAHRGKRIDSETIDDIHRQIGSRIGSRFFIIAPKGVFDFANDFLDREGVRYYALRIPYLFINELHQRGFASIRQPSDPKSVNGIVESYGFDFIQPPHVAVELGIEQVPNSLTPSGYIEIKEFRSNADPEPDEEEEEMLTPAMLMLDLSYDGKVFKYDLALYGKELQDSKYRAGFPLESLGDTVMALIMDSHGNEATLTFTATDLESGTLKSTSGVTAK